MRVCAAALACAVLLPAWPARAATLRVGDAALVVQSAADWDRDNAADPSIPRTSAGVLRLAREVWPPLRPAGEPGAPLPQLEPLPGAESTEVCEPLAAPPGPDGGCGTPDLDRIYRALANPRLDPRVVRAVQRMPMAGRPALEKEHTTAHFYFRYTTVNVDPLQNSSRANVVDLGRLLEEDYAAYTAAFGAPRNTAGRINVYLFHAYNGSWLGRTSFFTNSIEFDAVRMKASCFRKTVGAHELFHRVQYASRATRPNWAGWEKWWTEGTAKWAEETRRPEVNDWTGWGSVYLRDPNAKHLNNRSYDLVPWWVYLSQRKQAAGGDWSVPVKRLLRSYEQGKATLGLLQDVSRIALGVPYVDAQTEWHIANYLKDSVNPDPKYAYADNAAAPAPPCESGPLAKVPVSLALQGYDGGMKREVLVGVRLGAAIYVSLTYAAGTSDVVGIEVSDPAGTILAGEPRVTVLNEKGGSLTYAPWSTSTLPAVYNIAPKSWDVDKAMVIFQAPVSSVNYQFRVNPQFFNGYWTVEETWDAWGYVFYTAWEIRGDTGIDPSVLKVEAAGYDGVSEVVHNVDGAGHVNAMTVTYPCFFCDDDGAYHFTGAVTPDTNFREMTGTFTFTYTDAEGQPATDTGTWKATRAGW